MEQGLRSPAHDRQGLAHRINDLSAAELDDYVKRGLTRRELHRVVRALNETVLSKAPGPAEAARRALARLGFPD